MHTNMTDDNLVSTATEEKKWRQLQHDAEWNDSDRAEFYKCQADHYKKLFLDGIVYEPKF
jgi:hypothetical protein